MKKDVTISLISTQSDGNETEQTELITQGKYMKAADGYVLSYDETEATGFEGAVTSLEVTGSKKIVMTRTGAVSSNLVIEPGKKHHCHYGTPYGAFMVGVNAKEIKNTVTEQGGHLEFRYVVDVNSSYIGDFAISIDVKSSECRELQP